MVDEVTRIGDLMRLLHDRVTVERRRIAAGDAVYTAGQRFEFLHVVHAGLFKTVTAAADGRCQIVSLNFRGDWLGFDGIAAGRHGCDVVASCTGEVHSVRYDLLLAAGAADPSLMNAMHAGMSRTVNRMHDVLLARCSLPVAARVADFLRHWADTLGAHGQSRTRFTLHLPRADIGNYLGMTLESVSRAFAVLVRLGVIAIEPDGRRGIVISDWDVLTAFIHENSAPVGARAK